MTAFVDTSFYIARIMPGDRWHEKALRAVRPGIAFFTSTLVVNETISLLSAGGPPQPGHFDRLPGCRNAIRGMGPVRPMGTRGGQRYRLRQFRGDAKDVDPEGVYLR
ncbi:MAG: hypothetical protein ABSF64_10005 [Bryobacteraceae bacterium]